MRVLVGFNGSEASTAALGDLAYAGLPDGSEILILTVAESWNAPKTTADADRIAALGVATIRQNVPNCLITGESATGSPPRELLARAHSFQPDLMVVGEPRQELRTQYLHQS